MKRIVFAFSFLASLVFANDFPTYLGPVKGTLLTGLTQREAFEFSPGELVRCERKEAMDFVVYHCDIKNTSAVAVNEKGLAVGVRFGKMHAFFRPDKKTGDFVREYIFEGDWQEKSGPVDLQSKVRLELWHYRSSPSVLKGNFQLVDYGLSASLQATQ